MKADVAARMIATQHAAMNGRKINLQFITFIARMLLTRARKLGRKLINGYADRPANDSNLEGGDWIMAHRRYDLIEFA